MWHKAVQYLQKMGRMDSACVDSHLAAQPIIPISAPWRISIPDDDRKSSREQQPHNRNRQKAGLTRLTAAPLRAQREIFPWGSWTHIMSRLSVRWASIGNRVSIIAGRAAKEVVVSFDGILSGEC